MWCTILDGCSMCSTNLVIKPTVLLSGGAFVANEASVALRSSFFNRLIPLFADTFLDLRVSVFTVSLMVL